MHAHQKRNCAKTDRLCCCLFAVCCDTHYGPSAISRKQHACCRLHHQPAAHACNSARSSLSWAQKTRATSASKISKALSPLKSVHKHIFCRTSWCIVLTVQLRVQIRKAKSPQEDRTPQSNATFPIRDEDSFSVPPPKGDSSKGT